MSNINEITDSEKLFTDLTSDEGAAISGGATFQLRNNLIHPMGIKIRGLAPGSPTGWRKVTIPGEETRPVSFVGKNRAQVQFDSKRGAPFKLVTQTITPDLHTFSTDGPDVILSSIGTFFRILEV